jgi:hypothetical protein
MTLIHAIALDRARVKNQGKTGRDKAFQVLERTMPLSLLPESPGAWPERDHRDLFVIPRQEREALQLEALKQRFARLRNKVPALKTLADKQGVERIERAEDVLPICFDHRVLKNYPLTILENRDFPKLTAWMNKLTMHDLTRVDLSGLKTIDSWIERLESYGMIIGTSSGTTGKLSFVARSKDDLQAWRSSWMQAAYAGTGVNPHTTRIPTFVPSYRTGNQMAIKNGTMFVHEMCGGPQHYHTLYDAHMSSDLMALSGKMQAAEEKGEIEKLGLDPALIEQRRQLIEQGRRRAQDVEIWFTKMIKDFRGQQVRIGGLYSDLFRAAQAGTEKGIKCEFAPGSIIVTGGGMKSFKNAPENWREIIMAFFGVDRLCTSYGFSENMGNAPACSHGFYHFFPYTIVLLMGADGQALPREGVQKGRMAVYDLLVESHWGGFVSGDEVTVHFEDDCPCGWRGPRVENNIRRYAEMEGGDDKITCAGSAKAYDEFMEFVMGQG